MKLRVNMTAALAVVVLVLAFAQYVAPFGPRVFRISPGILIVIALLLAARYGAYRQAKKRDEILKAVPRRPLGLSDDSP
jgi:hypothetical protein